MFLCESHSVRNAGKFCAVMSTLDGHWLDLLRQADLLPADSCATCPPSAEDQRGNLFPIMFDAWSRAPRTRHSERVVAWLRQQCRQHAELTLGVPDSTHERVARWVGPRLIWWPRGVPPGRRVSIVSSRLGRLLERHRPWFAALRGVCRDLDADSELLTAARDTATAPYLTRCSELFRIPLLLWVLPSRRQAMSRWWSSCRRIVHSQNDPATLQWTAVLSPLLSSQPAEETPLRDRIVVAAANRIVACKIRSGGHIEQLVRRRLTEDAAATDDRVLLMIGPGLIPDRLIVDLQQLGAETRSVADELSFAAMRPHPAALLDARHAGRVRSVEEVNTAGYLIHCTRHAGGPWPDESVEAYQDALILGRAEADHSALSALARIAVQQRLLATSRAIRDRCSVVCFSAVDLKQIKKLRTFRAHRGRWDFEPYGICIRTDWLELRGARPVHYGDTTLWNQLPATEHPFFQRRYAGSQHQIDWSVEREWRHLGDIDLSELPADAAFLFVPTLEEALQLDSSSRWPVVVLE